MSMWKDAPLLSKTKPPRIQFYAWTQMGRCVYRHGGIDFSSANSMPENNDVWEFDIDKRTWRVVEVGTGSGSNVPEHRSAHTMFSWKGDLYIWGGMQEFGGQRHVAKPDLYRLKMKGQKTPQWELVKTKHKPPGRSEHAGVVYRGKYYITCGNFGAVGPGNDTWCLNLSNFKWASLRNNGNGPVIKRHCHNMWAANNKMYVLGGRIAVRGSSGELSNCSSPSIEEFVSYDLETKTWSTVDIIGDDRPHDLSEYTVLPLYKEELDDDPSTIIVWGGYREVELSRLNEGDVEGKLKAQYGEEWRAYTIPYISRLLRFDTNTNVWKRLQPIKDVLPKAQSIACVDKVENGVIHLLIGEGYGIDPEFDKTSEENKEEIKRIIAADACAPDIQEVKAENYHSPKASNKMYEIMITEAFGDADLKNCWSWDIYRLADNKKPRLRIAIAPGSPTLHNMIDLTYEDFMHPVADDVLPNDEQNLLGVRVKLHGLVGRKDLNGMVARCGHWMAVTERYQVFLPLYESDSSISVKPANLNLAGPVTPEELARLSITHSAYPRRFPRVGMAVQILNDSTSHRIVRPLMEEILDAPIWDEDTKLNQLFDSYLGPVSGKAQIILRTIGIIEPKTRSGFACAITAAKFTRPKNSKQAKHAKNMEIYVNFLRDLKEQDTVRVQGFEAKVAKVDDSMVLRECSEWLKLTVKLDGVLPPVTRELIISPHVTVRCLHDQVLTAVMGWASNFHAYAFRKIPFIVDELNHDISLSSTTKICDSLEVMKESCWMGPKVSTALDSMFMPLYIGGCLANDTRITLGQLFALDELDDGKMYLQYVHDYGDWWSHSITVSKYADEVPNTSVAYLMSGQGGSLPEDIGGMPVFMERINQLTGKLGVELEDGKMLNHIDPNSEHWWELLNVDIRRKSNMRSLFENPLEFNLEKTRAKLDAAIRRPTQKFGKESMNMIARDLHTPGLTYENNKKCSVSLPKNATKFCAVCSVTVTLRKCSVCQSVAYCSREHQVEHWSVHKHDCKRLKKENNKGK